MSESYDDGYQSAEELAAMVRMADELGITTKDLEEAVASALQKKNMELNKYVTDQIDFLLDAGVSVGPVLVNIFTSKIQANEDRKYRKPRKPMPTLHVDDCEEEGRPA